MSESFSVSLSAMSAYAMTMDDAAAQCRSALRFLQEADVADDSFGLLPECRETADAYETRTTVGLDVLKDGERVFTDLGVAFRQMRDNYRASDERSAERFGGHR